MDKETTSQPEATGLTRDNGMLKLHTCRLAHAHLVFALVITNRITLWAHFVHTCMDTPPLTTYMYMYMLYTILLVSWPSPYTVAFSLYCWPSPYTVGLLPIQLAFSLYSWPSPYRWPSPYTVGLLLHVVLLAFSLYCWPSLKVFIHSMHGITCSTLLSLLSTVRLSTVVLQA